MKTGDVVIVKVDPFVDRHYLYTGKRKAGGNLGVCLLQFFQLKRPSQCYHSSDSR